jgi:hypothetical protein
MAKDPAVLFYTSDFLTGTFSMTNEQVGKYIRLLCLQHQKGKLTEKDMLSICKAYDEDVYLKFRNEAGLFFNERMFNEGEKRKKYSESRKKNAQTPKNQLKTKKAYAEHMENANVNVDINESLIVIKGGRFKINEVGDLPEIKIGSAKELLKITKNIDLTEGQILGLWDAFKIQHLTGEKYYKSEEEVHSHFLNWLQTKKINGNKSANHSVKTEGAYTLLDKIKTASRRS